jgi:hypothetical protein
MSGIDAASSENVFRSARGLVCLLVPEVGNRNENLRFPGVPGVCGLSGGVPLSKSFIERAVSSLAIAIAQSKVRWSAAEIGFTYNETFIMLHQYMITLLDKFPYGLLCELCTEFIKQKHNGEVSPHVLSLNTGYILVKFWYWASTLKAVQQN